MYRISNFTNNDDIKVLNSLGPFTVIEYQRDLSVMPHNAALAYFCNEMNVRKRQVICDVNQANITLQAGAMQWTVGNVNATTGVKGVGDFFTNNDDIKVLNSLGPFTVIEYQRDLSVMPHNAALAYFCNEMNVRKRQVICDVNQANITLQAGAMQWTVGNVNATTGVKGVGDFFGKAVRGKATGESAIKPEYTGNGILVLEPTYKHILLVDLKDWNGSIVLDDGLLNRRSSRNIPETEFLCWNRLISTSYW